MAERVQYNVDFSDLARRYRSPLARTIWERLEPHSVKIEGVRSESVGAVVGRAVDKLQQLLSNCASDEELAQLTAELQYQLRPYSAEPSVTRQDLLRWLTDPSPTNCTYTESEGRLRLIPFSLGATEYRVLLRSQRAPTSELIPKSLSSRGLGPIVELVRDGARMVEAAKKGTAYVPRFKHRKLWAVDAYDAHASLDFDSNRVDVRVALHTGLNTTLVADDDRPPSWAVLQQWGPIALGLSRIPHLIPRAVWNGLYDDERWMLEEAASLVVDGMLPEPPWLREANLVDAMRAYVSRDKNGAEIQAEMSRALGLSCGGDPSDAFAYDETSGVHPILKDTLVVLGYRQRNLFAAVKRLLGLLEYRARRSGVRCSQDDSCLMWRERQDEQRKKQEKRGRTQSASTRTGSASMRSAAASPRACDSIGQLWLSDAVKLSDRVAYECAWKGWSAIAGSEYRNAETLNLGELVAVAARNLPCSITLTPTAHNENERNWHRAVEIPVAAWHGQITAFRDALAATAVSASWYAKAAAAHKDIPASTALPGGAIALAALGQLMLQLRNLLEHSAVTASSLGYIELDTANATPARRGLGLGSAEDDKRGRIVRITARDLESCLRLAILFLVGWHHYPTLSGTTDLEKTVRAPPKRPVPHSLLDLDEWDAFSSFAPVRDADEDDGYG